MEAAGEAEDTLPELISQEDEAADELDDFASVIEDDDQVEDFQDSQQYPRGGPLDIDPSDPRLDYKERAQKAEMENKALTMEVEELKKVVRELEGREPRVEEDEEYGQLRAQNRGLQDRVEELLRQLEIAETDQAIALSKLDQSQWESQKLMLQNTIRDLEEKIRQMQAKNGGNFGTSAHNPGGDFMRDGDEDGQQDVGNEGHTEENPGSDENEADDGNGQSGTQEDGEDEPQAGQRKQPFLPAPR